jgi:hypothetical protein
MSKNKIPTYGLVHDGDVFYLMEIFDANIKKKLASSFCTPFLPDTDTQYANLVKGVIKNLQDYPFIWKTESWSRFDLFRFRQVAQRRAIVELASELKKRLDPKKDKVVLTRISEIEHQFDLN